MTSRVLTHIDAELPLLTYWLAKNRAFIQRMLHDRFVVRA
jgi:hypothetical protein